MEGPSAATKRGAKAVSRRGPQPTYDEGMQPLSSSVQNQGGGTSGTNGSGNNTMGKANPPAAPRSGQFLLHQTFPNIIEKDDNLKRRYRVNLPYRMLFVLAMVFLMIPLLIFFYKETHIHRTHDHYKPERFINVKTKDVLSQFSDHAHGTTPLPLADAEEDSTDEVAELVVEEKKPESVEHDTENVPKAPIVSTEAKEETIKEQEKDETTPDQKEQQDDLVEVEELKDKKVEVESTPNDTSAKTDEGKTVKEKVQEEGAVVEDETKQRIRRRQ